MSDVAYKELVRWVDALLQNVNRAEVSAIRHLAACQQSFNNAQQDAKSGTAKDRLAVATKALREAEKIQEWNWVAGAVLELIANKSINLERRFRLPPTILSWIDNVASG